ncbi:MAG: class I SAM-dependent methyltransferase, partial [Candidatus Brocadiia bacterium]|nr:class I SAM-dependent methyltransferase [Candidatus Brocadiia bacterium]
MAADADKEPSNDFDPISDVYEEMVAWAPYGKWVRDLAQRLRRHRLRRGGPVLDAACGTGLSTFPWAESGYRVLGVDRSEPMLALARAKLAGRDLPIRFERSDLLQLDLPGSFDLAVCMHSGLDYILNLERLARAFRCLRSTLRPGGLLAFDKCLDEPGFYREPYSNARPITNGQAVFHYSWDSARKLFIQRCSVERSGPDGGPQLTEVTHYMLAVELGKLIRM